MKLVGTFLLALVITCTTVVRSNPDIDRTHGDLKDLKSEAARQKIYEIISSHENRKYGDHGGHEYEEGEVPKRSSSRKSKRYGYLPDEGDYYYVEQPKQSAIRYEPKAPVDNVYIVPSREPGYSVSKEHYPVEEAAYVQPKHGYADHSGSYSVPHKPEHVYGVPNSQKVPVYHENVGGYVEDKTAPITIGKTARTIYPNSVPNTHYAVFDPKAPSEYLVLEGQKPPRPLILDPKLKETYHLNQPAGHYSAPEHQVVKPQAPLPVHYPAPVKEYEPTVPVHYSAPVKEYEPKISVPVHYSAPLKEYERKIPAPSHYPTPVKEYEQYNDHHKKEEKGHHSTGHGYYNDKALKKESGHKSHGHHESAGHKAHSSVAGHHDEHDHHHNRGVYERDRGYHYEKAYAYDRVRAHHDIGSTKGAHSSYGAHHGHEGHKDAGHHGGEHYSYFKKDGQDSGYGYNDGNSLYKKGHDYYQGQKYVPVYYHG